MKSNTLLTPIDVWEYAKEEDFTLVSTLDEIDSERAFSIYRIRQSRFAIEDLKSRLKWLEINYLKEKAQLEDRIEVEKDSLSQQRKRFKRVDKIYHRRSDLKCPQYSFS